MLVMVVFFIAFRCIHLSTPLIRLFLLVLILLLMCFFFNDPATTAIYTLSLHDALPLHVHARALQVRLELLVRKRRHRPRPDQDRKSTRLNSSHVEISYAVFCLKKKKGVTDDGERQTMLTLADTSNSPGLLHLYNVILLIWFFL